MATLLLLLLVAVVLVVISLRALLVAIDALRLTYRLSLAERMQRDQAQHASLSGPVVPSSHSSYPPIRVLYTSRRPLVGRMAHK